MSNFSFSQSVFKRLVLQTRKNQDLFGKGLIYTFQAYCVVLSKERVKCGSQMLRFIQEENIRKYREIRRNFAGYIPAFSPLPTLLTKCFFLKVNKNCEGKRFIQTQSENGFAISPFPIMFSTHSEKEFLFLSYIYLVVCEYFQLGSVQNFVIW